MFSQTSIKTKFQILLYIEKEKILHYNVVLDIHSIKSSWITFNFAVPASSETQGEIVGRGKVLSAPGSPRMLSPSILEWTSGWFRRMSLSDSTCSSQKAFTRQGHLLEGGVYLCPHRRAAFIAYEAFIRKCASETSFTVINSLLVFVNVSLQIENSPVKMRLLSFYPAVLMISKLDYSWLTTEREVQPSTQAFSSRLLNLGWNFVTSPVMTFSPKSRERKENAWVLGYSKPTVWMI